MEYGKFNSADELLKGYIQLEKSFTQKCQQLAALEKQLNGSGTSEITPPQPENAQSTADDAVGSVPCDGADSRSQVNCSAVSNPDERIGQYHAPHPEYGTAVSPQPQEGVLSDANRQASPKVMTGGGNVSPALPNRPRTIKEASDLAKKYFD